MLSSHNLVAAVHFVQAFFIFAGKVQAKFKEYLVGNRADMPHVACNGEDVCGFKENKSQIFDGIVSQGIPWQWNHCTLHKCSQSVLICSSGVHSMAMLMQLASSSA